MRDYDSTSFNPPAPIAYVTIKNPLNNSEVTNVPMLLDTGADATLIPQFFVEKLALSSANNFYEIESFDGTITESAVVNLQIIFENKSFRGEFLTIKQDYGIIGRNILNLLTINFDGKSLRWEIL